MACSFRFAGENFLRIFFQGTPTTAGVAITTRGLTPGVPTPIEGLAVGTEGQTAGMILIHSVSPHSFRDA